MSSSLVPLKTRRVGERCTLNLWRGQTSSRWCGGVEQLGEGVPAQVSSSSLDHGSKLRGPSPKALVKPPKKGTPFGDPKKKRNFASKWIKEGISFANVVSGEVPNQIPIDDKKEDSPHGFLSQDSNNTSDLTQVLELFQIISNLVKKNPKILDLLTKFKKLTQMKKNLPSRRSNYG
ncbi:uncharacterized protein TNCV_4841871 [Trichonephila clavipes]|uniref:Uncharacterized protein n=1 Tax=Trichonephila clavipes TaxID=2585209 RepID=A0A8X6WJ37_TRICX|nr:uncharacterized protein TNCV_4841871 [Trichonephila clavipes]